MQYNQPWGTQPPQAGQLYNPAGLNLSLPQGVNIPVQPGANIPIPAGAELPGPAGSHMPQAWQAGGNVPNPINGMSARPHGFMSDPRVDPSQHAQQQQHDTWVNSQASVHTGNYGPHVSRTFTQPHMAKYHSGMNGFPLVPTAGNGTLLSSHTSSQVRAPFGCASCITMYQFPSPTPVYAWSGLGAESLSQTALSSLQTSYESRSSVMSTNENSVSGPTVSMSTIGQIPHCNYPGMINMPPNGVGGSGLSKGFGKHPKKSSAAYARAHLHSKRKGSRAVEEPGPPPKVFINEERMSACLRDMNLDNNNLGWHPDLEEQPWYSQQAGNNNNNNEADMQTPNTGEGSEDEEHEVADIENCADRGLPRLEISKDLKLSVNTKELLPKVILDEIARPHLQVVLWKPPGDFIKDTIQTKPDPALSLPDVHSGGDNTICSPHSDSNISMEHFQLDTRPPIFNLPASGSQHSTTMQPTSSTVSPPHRMTELEALLQDNDSCMDL